MLISALWISFYTYAQSPAVPGWTDAQLAAANTAADADYLSEDEKKVILLTNLARLDGALFAKTYLKDYLQRKQAGSKPSTYVNSLIKTLNGVKGLTLLKPNERLCQSAKYHAKDMGKKGMTGHNSSDGTDAFTRIQHILKPTGNYGLAENCAYGFADPTDNVMQLLIDEGIRDLGHRKNMLSPKFNLIGVSIQPHKTYRYNCVQDFASMAVNTQ